ncbi:MAG: CYTH domain-containing protein [Bacilli bacterium]|nr:CYTH domain-containing protein [Bacilli bacterium]
MPNAVEIEAKVLVSENNYQKLVALFKDLPSYKQTNYYIDTENRVLKSKGVSLRIRTKKGQHELTLKKPIDEGLLEKNQNISEEEFEAYKLRGEFPNGEVEDFLKSLCVNTKDLYIITHLTTTRTDVSYEGGLLSIDKNEFSNQVDYEVEFEYSDKDGAENILRGLLERNGIPVSFNKISKTGRAFKAIQK